MLLREVFDRWRSVTERAPGTFRARETSLRVLESEGIARVDQGCDPRCVARFVENRLADGLSPRTVSRDVVTLTVLLGYLRRAGELDRATVETIMDLCPEVKARRRRSADFLDERDVDELARVAKELGHEQSSLAIRIVQWAGLRTGELLGLCVEHVDLEKKHIRVVEDERISGRSGLKTGERFVPLCRELRDILVARMPALGPIFPCTRRTRSGRTVLTSESLCYGLRRAVEVLGWTRKIELRLLRKTRETTWARNPKVTRAELAEWMGHSMDVSERYYLSVRSGYSENCETPVDHKTTKAMLEPPGRTPTRPLTKSDLVRVQAAERALLRAREKRDE